MVASNIFKNLFTTRVFCFWHMLLSWTSVIDSWLFPQIILSLGQGKWSSPLKPYLTEPIHPHAFCPIQLLLPSGLISSCQFFLALTLFWITTNFLPSMQYFLLIDFIFKSVCHFYQLITICIMLRAQDI